MQKIMLTIAYDGTHYHGWQRQKNAITVQEVLEDALTALLKQPITVHGCSRTDAGVHAAQFVLHFEAGTAIGMEKLPIALNTFLPRDIRVTEAAIAEESFHARFDAAGKTYRYRLTRTVHADPFTRNYAYHYPYPLQFEPMAHAAASFVGRHDFAAFAAAGSTVTDTVRTMTACTLTDCGAEWVFRITGDGFLYNMVRIMVGTLLYVGRGKLAAEEIPLLLKGGKRENAGVTVPPEGLCLEAVYYDREKMPKREILGER